MLIEALQLAAGECIAVVGAGGKTSLCWLLARELVGRGERAVFTTTTRIRQPQPEAFDRIVVGGDPAALLDDAGWRSACIAARVDGAPDDTPLDDSLMPVVHTKLAGFSAEQVCDLYRSISNLQSPITFLVEADGARGLMLKAPADYEPVIPACATSVCIVANLDCLGRPLDGRVAHRPERIAALTGAQMGEPITPELVVSLLAHPQGGLKGIPAGARRIAVLMQRDAQVAHPDAAVVVDGLVARGYERAIVLSPHQDVPCCRLQPVDINLTGLADL
ncbi:MAG: selenium cofactor biosynthesis protein YqeC [Chloroflexi bacterium]|nr:selenium cofactor biosynthesis protein YqeC [Chloroflexota bacterium]